MKNEELLWDPYTNRVLVSTPDGKRKWISSEGSYLKEKSKYNPDRFHLRRRPSDYYRYENCIPEIGMYLAKGYEILCKIKDRGTCVWIMDYIEASDKDYGFYIDSNGETYYQCQIELCTKEG